MCDYVQDQHGLTVETFFMFLDISFVKTDTRDHEMFTVPTHKCNLSPILPHTLYLFTCILVNISKGYN